MLLASSCAVLAPLDNLSGGSGSSGDDGSTPSQQSMQDASNGDDGSRNAVAADAASGPDAASVVDSTAADTSDAEGLSASDTGAGPPPPTEAGGGSMPFCASLSPQPLFCEDFDEGSCSAGWSTLHMVAGNLSLDQGEFHSPPGAMIAQVGAASSGNVDVAAYRSFSIAGSGNLAATIDLDLRVDGADASGGLAVLAQLALYDGSGSGSYFVQLVGNSSGTSSLTLSINEIFFGTGGTGMPVVHSLPETLPLGAWTHFSLVIDAPFGGGSGTVTTSFDGDQPTANGINVPVTKFTEELGVGLTFVRTPTAGWTAVYDDAAFEGAAR